MPSPSITKRSFVPSAVEEAILNLPPSEMSFPMIQSKSTVPSVEVAEKRRDASTSLVSMVNVEVAVMAPPKKDVPEMNALPSTERVAEGELEAMPTEPPVSAKRELPSTAIEEEA